MFRSGQVIFATAAVAWVICIPATAAAHNQPATSLGELGVGRLVLVPHGRPTRRRPYTLTRSRPYAFSLPTNAHQGGHEWFVMRLHFRLELADDSGSGLVDVSASTDGGWSSDLVEIHVRRVGSATRLHWSKVGLIAGAATGQVVGHSLELADANIMLVRGIRPGPNTLQFELRSSGKARVARVVVYPNSGVYTSRFGPGTLRLHLSASPGPELHVGQTLHVKMTLRDPHPRPVRRVNVDLSYDKKHFRLLNPPAQMQIPAVTHDRPYQRTFDLRTLAVGTPTVDVLAQSVNASPEATVTPTIVATGGFRWNVWLPLIALVAGATLFVIGRHVRTTQPEPRVERGEALANHGDDL